MKNYSYVDDVIGFYLLLAEANLKLYNTFE